MSPKNIHKIFIPKKILIFWNPPKILKFKTLNPKKWPEPTDLWKHQSTPPGSEWCHTDPEKNIKKGTIWRSFIKCLQYRRPALAFSSLQKFSKSHELRREFSEILSECVKQLGFISDQKFCQTWSRSKLFAKYNSLTSNLRESGNKKLSDVKRAAFTYLYL